MTSDKEQAAEEFVEVMGLVLQGDGLSRTAGRILAMLVLMDEPAGLDEIADFLQVSRSGVSTNTRELERMGAVRRSTRAGDRQIYFELIGDSLSPLLNNHVERMSQAAETVRKTSEAIPPDWGKAKERLDRLARFYLIAIEKAREVIQEFTSETQEDAEAAPGEPEREGPTHPLRKAADGH